MNLRSTQCSEEALEDQRLTLQLPEIIAPPIAWGGYNVMRNVPQGHVNFKRNLFPILHLLYALYSSTKPRLQSNRVERNVEFVFSPQHETSSDPETTTKEDADH